MHIKFSKKKNLDGYNSVLVDETHLDQLDSWGESLWRLWLFLLPAEVSDSQGNGEIVKKFLFSAFLFLALHFETEQHKYIKEGGETKSVMGHQLHRRSIKVRWGTVLFPLGMFAGYEYVPLRMFWVDAHVFGVWMCVKHKSFFKYYFLSLCFHERVKKHNRKSSSAVPLSFLSLLIRFPKFLINNIKCNNN